MTAIICTSIVCITIFLCVAMICGNFSRKNK